MSDNDAELIVIGYGACPSKTNYDILAYGKKALMEARERDVVEGTHGVRWDGSCDQGPIGGHYARVKDNVAREALEAVREAHELPEEAAGIAALDDEGTVVEQELVDLDEV